MSSVGEKSLTPTLILLELGSRLSL